MEKLGVASLMVVVSGVLFAAGCAGRGAGDSGTASGAVEAGIERPASGATDRPQVQGAAAGGSQRTARQESGRSDTWDVVAHGAEAGGRSDDLRPIPSIWTSPEAARGEAAGREFPEAPAPQEPGRKPARGEVSELALDDFEGGLRWKPVTWENANECSVSLASSDTGTALALECRDGSQEKAGGCLSFAPPLDLSGFNVLALDVTVRAGAPQSIAVGWQTDGYFESVGRRLEPGWSGTVTFSLTAPDYKTAPRWEHESVLKGRHAARELFILVYYEGACTLVIDNVRLHALQPATAAGAARKREPT